MILPFILRLEKALGKQNAQAVQAWLGTFYGFQLNWLLDMRRLAALNKCRQIGGSHTFAAWAVLHALWGENTTLVSRAEKEAIDLLSKVKKHLSALQKLGCVSAFTESENRLEVVLVNGAKISATTSKAAARGTSGNVVLDEFAYHDDPKSVWDAALAAITHGYSARILSTPNGVGNLWYQLVQEIGHRDPTNPKGWLVYETTIEQAIADGMALDMDFAWDMAGHDSRLFDQLFRGKFIDNEMQYIPGALIEQCLTDKAPSIYDDCFGGLDIGESRDRTTLVVLQGETVLHTESHGKTDDALLAKLFEEAFSVHNCLRVGVDATGMGTFPAKAARKKHGAKVELIQFTNQTKESMATRLYQTMVDGQLWIPRGEAQLRDDLASLRRIVTTAGNVRFDAPRTSKGHADLAWGLMMALQASSHGAKSDVYLNMRRLKGA